MRYWVYWANGSIWRGVGHDWVTSPVCWEYVRSGQITNISERWG